MQKLKKNLFTEKKTIEEMEEACNCNSCPCTCDCRGDYTLSSYVYSDSSNQIGYIGSLSIYQWSSATV